MTEFLSTPMATRVAGALLHFLWQGTLLCLLYPIAVNLNLLRTPRARYLFALALFALMALCPVITFLGMGPVSVAREFVASSAADVSSASQLYADTGAFGYGLVTPEMALCCWMIGVLLLSLRLLDGYRQLRRWRAETLDLPLALQTQIATLGQRIGLKSIPEVRLSVHVNEALAMGFWKPAILLPVSWATELPISTLEAIIAHELAHIRRFDLWVNLGQRVVETLLFYHPAIWWLSNRIREERELCCDELAAQATGESLGYALALEGVARYLAGSHTLLGTSFLGDRKMKLLKRVRHVLGQSSSTKRKLWWPAGIMALMLPIGIYGTSLTAQDAPREGDRPRPERAEDRREGERERPREGDRDRPPREGDRPQRDADRPRPPRGEGDRPPRGPFGGPRDGDRPREGVGPRPQRDGAGPPRGQRDRGPRDLYREIEMLREEVRRLREEIRRQGPPPPREGFGPPRDGFWSPRDGEGPPRDEGDRLHPPREGDRPRREGDRPRGEGDGPRPPRDGDRPRAEGDRPRPPREGDRPREGGDRPRGAREEGPDRPRRPETDAPKESDAPREE